MTREELIKVCKYYKGEEKNPYDWEKQNVAHEFWDYEELFCIKYERGRYCNLSPKKAIQIYLNELFIHLEGRYETPKSHFENIYFNSI